MVLTKSTKKRADKSAHMYGITFDMGQILRYSRKGMGLRYEYMAQCMDISPKEWLAYERNKKPIPAHIIIKLVMFGMEFWARNKQCFGDMSNDHPGTLCHPSTGGELTTTH